MKSISLSPGGPGPALRSADAGDGDPSGVDRHDLFDRAALLAGVGAWQCDLRTGSLTWTAGVFDLFGLPRQASLDRADIVAMYEEESGEAMERLRADAIARQGRFSLDAQIVRADGERRWMRLTAATHSTDGRATHLYGLKQDITAERERWEALRRLAEQDALTGLAGRYLFQSRFLDTDPRAPSLAPLGALLLFDVDGFKQVNDTWGHAAGDACLRAVSERLRTGFPDALMIARIGGDEFAVLTPAGHPAVSVERVAEQQLALLAQPIVWRGELLNVSASAGIAIAHDPYAYDPAYLFTLADQALYSAKRMGRNRARSQGLHLPHSPAVTRIANG
jgi:diguanylate cyclase (GGDEF)-like protein/PAS domain S-box-containing protein